MNLNRMNLRSILLATSLSTTLLLSASPSFAAQKEAIFAGGCFWCIEKDFEHVAGVIDVMSGYTGGTNEKPTYKNHSKFNHREVVKIVYDDTKVSYETLLHAFFRSVDPTDAGGQFCDRGHSYTTAIYTLDDGQIKAAKAAKAQAGKDLERKIATVIEAAQPFTPAEDYHQDYYKKSKVRYNYYRYACGRDKTVKALWGNQAYSHIDKSS